MARPMKIEVVQGFNKFFRVSHNNHFICLIHRACDNGPDGMDDNGQWNGRYVWVHADETSYPLPNRIAFGSFQEAYSWACDSEGIVPLF